MKKLLIIVLSQFFIFIILVSPCIIRGDFDSKGSKCSECRADTEVNKAENADREQESRPNSNDSVYIIKKS